MSAHLSSEQLEFFHREGYLMVEDVVSDDVIEAIKGEYAQRLDVVAKHFHAAGEVSQLYADLPFGERFTRLIQENGRLFDHLDITLPLQQEMPQDADLHTGPAVFALLTHPPLLDVVESIIGPEIYSNPVQHVRIKPPSGRVSGATAENSYIAKTTWHQDQGALLDEANDSQILTVWVALVDATPHNGCMVCIPRSHRKDGGSLTVHCPGKNFAAENYIPTTLLDEQSEVPMPVRKGGVVLLHQFTEHAALPNQSDAIRWSFDLRYNPIGQATGRPAFPGFVARSQANPASELRDAAEWARLWQEARQRILSGQYEGQIFNAERWAKYADAPVCA